MKWADIIENIKRKLKNVSAILEMKDIDNQEKESKDFEKTNIEKTSSMLKKVAI